MPSTNRHMLTRAVFLIVLVSVTEALAYAALGLFGHVVGDIRPTSAIYAEQTTRIQTILDASHPSREIFDPLLGWRYRAGYRQGNDEVNTQGLRSERLYDPLPPHGILRIAAFGDSMVYGNEVGTSDGWATQMESLCPKVEVLNYGVGGYGLDQAYLRYQAEGSRYAPHVVLVGFVADDLRRLVNVYRRFIDDREYPLFKPRFVLDKNDLKLLPTPVDLVAYEQLITRPEGITEFGRHDHWYQPLIYENRMYDWSATVRLLVTVGSNLHRRYIDPDRLWDRDQLNKDSEAFKLQLAIFKHFTQEARRNGSKPLIVLFPDKASILRVRAGSETYYASIANALKEGDIAYVDLIDAFRMRTEAVDSFFMPGGHYSVRGNEIAAKWLLQKLPEVHSERQEISPVLCS